LADFAFADLEPGVDMVGMAHRQDDAQRGAAEGAAHLDDKFFLRIKRRAETARCAALRSLGRRGAANVARASESNTLS